MIFFYRKNLYILFKDANNEGNIDYSIKKENEELVIENLTRKTIEKIRLCDLKQIIVNKKTIIIKTMVIQTLLLPKTNELIDFLKKNNLLIR